MAKKAASPAPTKSRAGSAKSVPTPAQVAATTPEQALEQLESLGNEATRKQNAKWAAGGIQPGATQFGAMCRSMVYSSELPITREASTNSFSRNDNTVPRTTRTTDGV